MPTNKTPKNDPAPADNMRGTPSSPAEQTANAVEDVMRNYTQTMRSTGQKVVMPGGRLVDATPYLASKFRTQDHNSPLSISGKNAKNFFTPEWVAAHPGYEYAWIQMADESKRRQQADIAKSHMRRGMYTFVPQEALRDDTTIPYTTHTSAAGSEWVQVYDVALVAVSPQVWEMLFKAKEAMGVSAVAGNVQNFYAGADETGAKASHEFYTSDT